MGLKYELRFISVKVLSNYFRRSETLWNALLSIVSSICAVMIVSNFSRFGEIEVTIAGVGCGCGV